jgi:hypothetical protein
LQDFGRDMPPRVMPIGSSREKLARPFQRDFHIGQGP